MVMMNHAYNDYLDNVYPVVQLNIEAKKNLLASFFTVLAANQTISLYREKLDPQLSLIYQGLSDRLQTSFKNEDDFSAYWGQEIIDLCQRVKTKVGYHHGAKYQLDVLLDLIDQLLIEGYPEFYGNVAAEITSAKNYIAKIGLL